MAFCRCDGETMRRESRSLVKGVGNKKARRMWLRREDASENIKKATHAHNDDDDTYAKVIKRCLLVCTAIYCAVCETMVPHKHWYIGRSFHGNKP